MAERLRWPLPAAAPRRHCASAAAARACWTSATASAGAISFSRSDESGDSRNEPRCEPVSSLPCASVLSLGTASPAVDDHCTRIASGLASGPSARMTRHGTDPGRYALHCPKPACAACETPSGRPSERGRPTRAQAAVPASGTTPAPRHRGGARSAGTARAAAAVRSESGRRHRVRGRLQDCTHSVQVRPP